MTLMSGAMLAFDEQDIDFQIVSTSGVGALIGMLYLAPRDGKTRAQALAELPNLFISNPLSALFPLNSRVFHKPGPFSGPVNDLSKLIPRFNLNPRDKDQGKRLYNDLLDLWVTAWTPSTLNGDSKGLMTALPLVDDFVDFKALKSSSSDFYLNAFNAASRRLRIFTQHELDANTYAAGQAMGFLYPPQTFGKDVYTIGAAHDPTGLQAIWMHPNKAERPDLIVCLDSMSYAYWREPHNIYDAFQLMLLNPIIALQRSIYAQYATVEYLYNQNLDALHQGSSPPSKMPRLYRVPMEAEVQKGQYAKLLDWSHGSAMAFEQAGRAATAPVAQALRKRLDDPESEELERYRFRNYPGFGQQHGAWSADEANSDQRVHGFIGGVEAALQEAIDAAIARRSSGPGGSSRPARRDSGGAGRVVGASDTGRRLKVKAKVKARTGSNSTTPKKKSKATARKAKARAKGENS